MRELCRRRGSVDGSALAELTARLKDCGFRHMVSVAVRCEGIHGCLTLLRRTERAFAAAEVTAAECVAPHFVLAAVRCARAVRMGAARQLLSRLADRSRAALLLVDEKRRVVLCNSPGQDILRRFEWTGGEQSSSATLPASWMKKERGAEIDVPGLGAHRVVVRRQRVDGERLALLEVKRIDRPQVSATLPSLSPRQLEVLSLAARGVNSAGIARRLAISVNTVKTHLKVAYERLGIHHRHQIPLRPPENHQLG